VLAWESYPFLMWMLQMCSSNAWFLISSVTGTSIFGDMQAPAFGKQYVLVLQGWVDLWNSVSAILHIICSWVLANITSESSHCFQKGNRNSGHRLCMMVCPSFWEDYYMLIYTTVGSWWTQWVVMAACHCRSWWRWRSLTLWVTLIMLWLHSLSCHL
jgi:hypothetical protein